MASAEFWYEFASTYSCIPLRSGPRACRRTWRAPCLAAVPARTDLLPRKAGPTRRSTSIRPRAGTCGAISSATCAAMGVPFKRPDPFPQPSLLAARWCCPLKATSVPSSRAGCLPPSSVQGLPIGERATLSLLLGGMRRRSGAGARARGKRGHKARLKAECARATELGMIGAPCLVTADGEVFWGNDRLEQGLDWAANAAGAA